MKITVRIIGILEAEMELPEPGCVSPLGVTNWMNWHSEQFEHSYKFIDRCAVQGSNLMNQSRAAIDEPEL